MTCNSGWYTQSIDNDPSLVCRKTRTVHQGTFFMYAAFPSADSTAGMICASASVAAITTWDRLSPIRKLALVRIVVLTVQMADTCRSAELLKNRQEQLITCR